MTHVYRKLSYFISPIKRRLPFKPLDAWMSTPPRPTVAGALLVVTAAVDVKEALVPKLKPVVVDVVPNPPVKFNTYNNK